MLVADCGITGHSEPTVFYKHFCLDGPFLLRTRRDFCYANYALVTRLPPHYFDLST